MIRLRRRSLLSRPLVRLGLRLLCRLFRLGPFALAALEIVIRFAWYIGYSVSRGSGSSECSTYEPLAPGYTDPSFATSLQQGLPGRGCSGPIFPGAIPSRPVATT